MLRGNHTGFVYGFDLIFEFQKGMRCCRFELKSKDAEGNEGSPSKGANDREDQITGFRRSREVPAAWAFDNPHGSKNDRDEGDSDSNSQFNNS